MKRYYVSHVDGLTRDSAFPEIRAKLVEAKLIGESAPPIPTVVRAWAGQVVERSFLHLFKRRGDAEAFLARLKTSPDDPRWAIFEVEVVGPISQILSVEELDLPDWPKVREIQAENYVDHLGDDSLKIRIVVEPRPDGISYEWKDLQPISHLINERLREEGITLFPYSEFDIAEDSTVPLSIHGED